MLSELFFPYWYVKGVVKKTASLRKPIFHPYNGQILRDKYFLGLYKISCNLEVYHEGLIKGGVQITTKDIQRLDNLYTDRNYYKSIGWFLSVGLLGGNDERLLENQVVIFTCLHCPQYVIQLIKQTEYTSRNMTDVSKKIFLDFKERIDVKKGRPFIHLIWELYNDPYFDLLSL